MKSVCLQFINQGTVIYLLDHHLPHLAERIAHAAQGSPIKSVNNGEGATDKRLNAEMCNTRNEISRMVIKQYIFR